MTHQLIRRARPLLGTVVTLRLRAERADQGHQACEAAFDALGKIQTLMSAHLASSDLGRISRAKPGETLSVHPWTHEIIGLAQYWFHQSGGRFDPCIAARQLRRPGLAVHPLGTLFDVTLLPNHEVVLKQPVMLDLGGIAKGYAVDKAVHTLQAQGISGGVIDAGGDIRAWGDVHSLCEVRHARLHLRDQRFKNRMRLQNQSLATSVSSPINPEFVRTGKQRHNWRSATVMAPDCVTADALTKWALQSSLLCPQLGKILRLHQARMWRSE